MLGQEHPLALDRDELLRSMDQHGIEVAIAQMRKEGVSDGDIDLMMRKTPARLLGLSN